MRSNSLLKFLLSFLILSLQIGPALPCSMYKITAYGYTRVGCNEDAWRLTSRIWFENGTENAPYGAAFTGSRYDGANGFAPQSGMNMHGLVFSRLASRAPKDRSGYRAHGKQPVVNPTLYLKTILHTCSSIDDVEEFINRYDQSYFLDDVFIYIDSSGEYLVVEPYRLIRGHDKNYVLSNFCPSATTDAQAMKLDRYRRGKYFLQQPADTSLAFLTRLSDTMHVCRSKIGDGTLLTSIWDPQERSVCLYFYHDYRYPVKFNLATELAKGDHQLVLPELFPPNREFQRLAAYQTPMNNRYITIFLVFSALFFCLSAVSFPVSALLHGDQRKYRLTRLMMSPWSILLAYYMVVLCLNPGVFYFPAPYRYPTSPLLSLTSYIPLLLLAWIIPAPIITFRLLRQRTWGMSNGILFSLHTLICLLLVGLSFYWKLLPF